MRFGIFAATVLVLVSFMTSGCGSKAAKGIPKRIPCQVKVTKGGAPVEGVSVILVSDALESSVNVSGQTDASGVAEIMTHRADFTGKGAPEGEYKVLLSKPSSETVETKSADELDAMSPQEKVQYAAEIERKIANLPYDVPLKLGSLDTSPLKATVSSSGGEILSAEMDEY